MADFIPTYPDSSYEAVYTSRDSDTNAVSANGTYTSYNNIRVRKSGDTNSALAPSTGVNAAVLAKNRADLTLYDSYVTSDGKYAPAVFAKDVETSIKLYRSSINTSGENSAAIDTYGGAIESYNNDLITNGEKSPAIKVYGYTTTIRGGQVITRGEESPIAEVKSDLVILNVDNLTSNMSDGICIVGEDGIVNSQDSDINILASGFYPEESEDEDPVNYSSKFAAVSIGTDSNKITGNFTANNGAINIDRPEYTTVFKVHNAKGNINLTGVKIDNENYTKFLVVEKGYGDGSVAKVNTISQTITGIINVDESSELYLNLNSSSGFTGRINPEGQSGNVEVTLISSFWSLTGDSYISKLTLDEKSAINTNGYTLWVSGYKYIPKDQEDEEQEIEYTTTIENYENNENACYYQTTSGILSLTRVIKEGNCNELDANEYGTNAAVLGNNANVTVANNTYITTEGIGSPGIVSYNKSYTSLNDSVIETNGDNSSAAACSHDSSLYIYNSNLKTSGVGSHVINVAPLSNTVYINGGNYIAEGEESAVVFVDLLNSGSVNISDVYMRSNADGIIVDGKQDSAINISKASLSANGRALYIIDRNNDHNNITIGISGSTFNGYSQEGAIVVDSAEVTLNISKSNIYGSGKVISAVNGSVVYLNVSGGYISGSIYADDTSMIYINLMEGGNLSGQVNANNIASKVNMVLRDSHWVVGGDSYITDLDVDKYSKIDIGNYCVYVNGEPSQFIVGSVVHYTSEDNTISEEDVVIIERTTIGEVTYYTLYDTDDRITYNNVLIDQIVFTGKIIDIEPILQLIDELARDESAGVVESGDTVVVSTSDKHGLLVDNEVVDLFDIHIKKSGDSKIGDDTSNAAVLVRNNGDLTLKDSDIISKATYANGIVSIGEGSIVKANNVQVNTESFNSSATVALDKGIIEGLSLFLKTLGPNSFGVRVEDDAFVTLSNSTIEVTGAGSNAAIVKDADITLKNCTINHDRSIAPLDISGECNVILSGGNISDQSSEIATGGLYIHNERSTDPVYPDGWDPDDHPSHDDPTPEPPGPGPEPQPDVYVRRAVYHYTVDTDCFGEIFTNNPVSSKDEIVIWVSASALLAIDRSTVNRTDDASTGGKNSRQYGVGAAILCTNGGIDIVDTTINTLANGGIAVFAFSEDSIINVSGDTSITTFDDESSALHVADGGIINCDSATIITGGPGFITTDSPAIRSDKGGGSITVVGGSCNTWGKESPIIYDIDGNISLQNVTIGTNASELVDIEGSGTVTFDNISAVCFKTPYDVDNCDWGIAMYTPTESVSEGGLCKFEATSGNIAVNNGGLFYITNASAEITLAYVNLNSNLDFLIRCTGNTSGRNWGTVGANGGKCVFNMINQAAVGDIYWDSLSELTINITNNSNLTTAIIDDETYNGGAIGANGFCDINIDATSTLVITDNSRMRNLVNNSENLIRDMDDKVVTIINTNNVLIIDGDSDYLISVNSYTGITEEN